MQKTQKNIDYFCILAGGGVRGTAYIGVLDFFDEAGINIKGMAGSSIGAMFSALYSVGYRHEELKDMLLSLNYQQFRDLYLPFGKEFGICRGDNFFRWTKKVLETKFYGDKYEEGKVPPITFNDIDKDLIIIATDVCSGRVKEFSRYKTPSTEIAHAVRASISIPGFFKPVWDENSCLVDGDIIKNLPLWTFSKDIIANHDSILEIRLESAAEIKKLDNPLAYFNAVIDTASNISTEFVMNLYGRNDKFDFIKIDTGDVGLIDFSISDDVKKWLIKTGYNTVKEHFCNNLAEKKFNIKITYVEILEHLIILKNCIQNNKINECKMEMGHLAFVLAKNSAEIDIDIYQYIIETKELFLLSLNKSILFGIEGLKEKQKFVEKTNSAIKIIEGRIYDIDSFLENFVCFASNSH